MATRKNTNKNSGKKLISNTTRREKLIAKIKIDPELQIDFSKLHDEQMLTRFQAAAFLAVSIATFDRMYLARKIPSYPLLNGTVRFMVKELREYRDSCRVAPITEQDTQ